MNIRSVISQTHPKTRSPVPDVMWYKFNNNILNYSVDNVGKIAGTTSGTAAYSIVNPISRFSYSFDGGPYDTGNFITLPSLTRSSKMSFSCFLNMTTIALFMRIFDFGGSFRLNYINNGNLTFNDNYVIELTNVPGTWKHIAFTVNNLIFTAYENGISKNPIVMTSVVAADSSIGYIGHSVVTVDPNLRGFMSDFRMYNRVLNNDEIFRIYQNINQTNY